MTLEQVVAELTKYRDTYAAAAQTARNADVPAARAQAYAESLVLVQSLREHETTASLAMLKSQLEGAFDELRAVFVELGENDDVALAEQAAKLVQQVRAHEQTIQSLQAQLDAAAGRERTFDARKAWRKYGCAALDDERAEQFADKMLAAERARFDR